MPYAAKRPCTRCGKLGQCVEHSSKRYIPLAQRTTADPPPRAKTADRGYGSRWQATRKGFLAKHRLCVLCKAEGRAITATVVDHIKPHRGDMVLFWQRDNWQPLCDRCHRTKTANEDSYRGADGKWGSGKA